MPDYDEYVNRARSKAAGEVDRSAVDYAWAATAIKRGHPADEVIIELERVSLKAAGLSRKARRGYLRRTVGAAERESKYWISSRAVGRSLAWPSLP
jgi:hypothetical protein